MRLGDEAARRTSWNGEGDVCGLRAYLQGLRLSRSCVPSSSVLGFRALCIQPEVDFRELVAFARKAAHANLDRLMSMCPQDPSAGTMRFARPTEDRKPKASKLPNRDHPKPCHYQHEPKACRDARLTNHGSSITSRARCTSGAAGCPLQGLEKLVQLEMDGFRSLV